LQSKNSQTRTLESAEFKLAYFPVPKTASTSMKHAFYMLEHGHGFITDPDADEGVGIHQQFFRTRSFYDIDHARYADYSRIAVIRDPARRIVSAYVNRVKSIGELAPGKIDMNLADSLGVPADPTLREFLLNIDKYRILSKSVEHHTQPFTRFLGHDLGYFTDVVKIGSLGELAEKIGKLTGRDFDIAHHNRSNSPEESLVMGKMARKSLLDYCAGDYALMKNYFRVPPALLK